MPLGMIKCTDTPSLVSSSDKIPFFSSRVSKSNALFRSVELSVYLVFLFCFLPEAAIVSLYEKHFAVVCFFKYKQQQNTNSNVTFKTNEIIY